MASKSEFTVKDAYVYNRSRPLRWIMSHVWRYKWFLIANACLYLVAWISFSYSQVMFGVAAEEIIHPTRPDGLVIIGIIVLVLRVLDGGCGLLSALSLETIAQRLARDSRQELYTSLLGKSQTFHNRQRVGDIMARATDDVNQMNAMINPGVLFISDTTLGIFMPLLMIAMLDYHLLLVPLLFVASYILTVRTYSRRLQPVVNSQRGSFGAMNAGLEETISGIEVVKASARENFEREKFRRNARTFRDWFAKQGQVEATYLPMLFYGFAFGLTFLHSMYLNQIGQITIPQVISVMALMAVLRFPVFISVFSFSLVQLGIASAERILSIINTETDMDENQVGYQAEIKGDIRFENVTFGDEIGMVLENISFHVRPGETLAIVGQTGSGKSKLTELINRTYDVTEGQVLIDGKDVREWSLASLRSQISRIEQDVFLFS
ncbi:MAG TPA: ABC transporter ATP-binding protein, partial [Phototrophicaceae bacterium]|nr:ABC transporter ATP-binding protein [Phototrophicaceae bacterium]